MMENNKVISVEDLYNSLLKHEDTFSCLSSFVFQAENFNTQISDFDIVQNYLHISGNCSEILQLVKDISDADSQTAVLIMQTLCNFLIRVASDLHMFMSVGKSFVTEVLSSGMKSIFNFLKVKQKSSRTKSALHLLTSMIALGGQTAHHVVSKLDFSHITFTHLFSRKNFSEEEDIRTAFINLIIIIMTTCDFSVIRRLVEVKGFLNDVLPGLISDRTPVILMVLSTFKKLIVESSLIPKSNKLRLFNDHSLKAVVQLYSFKGPIRTAKKFKRKLGEEEQPMAYEVSEEERLSVKKCAHEFMLSVCCSFKTGIIFRDPSCGTSGKNLNQVLTKILKYMPKPHLDELVSDFVISVLKICPDQMHFYLPHLQDSCSPRYSPLWVKAIDVVKKVILAQDPISCLFNKEEKKSIPDMIAIAKTICFPNVMTPSEISVMFQKGHVFICYHICDFLACVLKQVKKIMKHCTSSEFSTCFSSADVAIFKQSLSSTFIQMFTFMKDLEDFWVKLTSGKLETGEVIKEDLPLPSLTDELLKILEVIQLYLDISLDGYHDNDISVPKLYQNFKNCDSLLSREDVCRVNIKIVDMIAVQGEEAISLWNKNLIDSPLMVLLDVYLTSPSTNMVDDLSQILKKVLMHTKVFEFCPWEMTVWLESMKSCKTKHISFIIEFINQTMCTLLQNPKLFADDIAENSILKSDSLSDVTTMFNDIFSKEIYPVSIEDSEVTQSSPFTQRQYFSSLVPAALHTLSSIDGRKRKGCQAFLENVLYHIIHHQQAPEVLYSVIQKYKTNISSNLYSYCELLCSSRFEQKIENVEPIICKMDLSDHLKMKFLTQHVLQDSTQGCHCNIQYEPGQQNDSYKEKILWQLLAYLEWEATLILGDKIENSDVICYLKLIEGILSSLNVNQVSFQDDAMQVSEGDASQYKNIKFQLIEEVLSRPVLLKLFLWTENVPKSKKTLTKDLINATTKLALNLITEVILIGDYHKILTGYKDKVVKFNSFFFQCVNLQKNTVISDKLDICHLIDQFSTLLSDNDVTCMLEELLNFGFKSEDHEVYFSTLLLVFKMYINLKGFIFIYPKTINSLLDKYVILTKKQKKNMMIFIMQMFEKHPILASTVEAGSCLALLKQISSKNFYILGSLIDCCNQQRQTIQLAIIANLETIKGSPDFIFLVSKCILNSALNETADIDFQNNVSLPFWDAITNYILMDVTSSDTLLEGCGAGKALQVLFKRNILPAKKLSKFLKKNDASLRNSVPSSSKMLIFLQLIEIGRSHILESNESALSVLRTTLNWLTSVISSYQNSSKFSYSPLLEFSFHLLQDIPEFDLEEIVPAENFFITILKVALKNLDPGEKLIEILNILCKKWNDLPAQAVFNLVTGHSNFFNIMLSKMKEEEIFKECVTDLLITLVSADNKVCKDNHLGLFLSSYSATLKSVDRKLLYLIKLYSESGIDMTKFSPLLWSDTAITYYSAMNSEKMHFEKRPKIQEVLGIFLVNKIETTAEKYPLTLKLEVTPSESCEELENCSQADQLYDLRFLLPLFADLLSPGSFLHCKSFLDSKVLTLIFTSLSTFDPNTRALGYYCLSQLYSHLEGAKYGDKQIWICFLDSVRNSIVTKNPRLPSIITLFLSKTAHIFTKPDHSLYYVLYKFIMVKPTLDIGHVPELYKLFNSPESEHRVQRLWLLRLLADGFRTSLDFHICEKRYLFRLLFTHYWSSISTTDERIEVLNIVSAAVKVDSSARILCHNALLVLLHNIMEETNVADVCILKTLCSLLKNLWFTVKKFCINTEQDHDQNNKETEEVQKNSLYSSFSVEFQLLLLKFLKKLKMLDISSVSSYLLTLKDVITFIKNTEFSDLFPYNMSLDHITEILEYWQLISEKMQHTGVTKHQSKSLNNASYFKECSDFFPEIILFWYPDWNCSNEQYYSQQISSVLRIVETVLQHRCLSAFYITDFPTWLYKCFKEDKKNELVKLFLSAEGENCLKLILDMFEQSLSVPSEFNKTKGHIKLCPESKIFIFNHWGKIHSHLKKNCKLYNLTPELNLYNQITVNL